MATTRKLTILMLHQDGTPFAGCASVRLASASKTDEELVGPLVWQESEFDQTGKVEMQLVPNSELEEGTYYRADVYQTRTTGGCKSKSKVFHTAFTMPDADSFLHNLAQIEEVKPSAQGILQLIASEATQAALQAETARSELSGAIGRIGALESRADTLETPLANAYIDGLFPLPGEGTVEGGVVYVLASPITDMQIDALFEEA